MDNVRNGFDQEVKRKLEEYLQPLQPEEKGQENPQLHQEEDRLDMRGKINNINGTMLFR